MNATFDRHAALRLFRLLKKSRGLGAQSLRISAVGEYIVFESGESLVSLPALVLEPGASTTRRLPFERLLGSFSGASTLTLLADAARFRLGAFSGQLTEYDPSPALPADFEPPADTP